VADVETHSFEDDGAFPNSRFPVLVYHDVLGMHHDHLAKFVRQYAHLADTATEALQHFFDDVQSGAFPSDTESYHMNEEAARALRKLATNEE